MIDYVSLLSEMQLITSEEDCLILYAIKKGWKRDNENKAWSKSERNKTVKIAVQYLISEKIQEMTKVG